MSGKDETSRSGHHDNVDGLEGKLKAEQSKRSLYSSSDSETSSSEEEILAVSRTEVEDGNSGEREVEPSDIISDIASILCVGCLG